ncbi:hypothetical protein PZ897_12605 [Hoeflea sp. YIM 152468]|uniref:hypothetical protein n=1 Tax=Hoeflea sp. YIM 152468 TaxID=3031759 RepID=UPI0023DA1F6B|nr:hypothetical protein [Hoeflea sp. YIM 152468]MDF1609018.1 hypothetical protein [Hoeflea sp. YIM 152468]
MKPAFKPKKYAITQIGERKDNRRVYPRRDANCPVIAQIRPRDRKTYKSVPSWMVNLCEDGCLLTSDHFPSKAEDIYLTIPGVPERVHAKARTQGKFTLNVKFTELLTPEIVEMIARIKTIPKT